MKIRPGRLISTALIGGHTVTSDKKSLMKLKRTQGQQVTDRASKSQDTGPPSHRTLGEQVTGPSNHRTQGRQVTGHRARYEML
ncbi:hypothetical protein PoB_007381200 [Plakobranchus ocellatus]|uniref:Uncharacterized protein n=1 Tax=Plakobranchus ocellatus TaxID=259542 RepID=A0AAV4DSK0_9GAST|nr:hypothetical protein PoB_007381200 [Plakobranchus ocellatus]